jgi:hypothetical protein
MARLEGEEEKGERRRWRQREGVDGDMREGRQCEYGHEGDRSTDRERNSEGERRERAKVVNDATYIAISFMSDAESFFLKPRCGERKKSPVGTFISAPGCS